MSDRRSSADLGSSAEAALSTFPFPERDWESDARSVEARLSEGVRGSTTSELLAAPLPSEPGEGSSASATATPLTNSGVRTQSLADLARRSVEKKQAGEREMARASLAIAAQQRPSSEEVRALRDAVGSAPTAAPPPPLSVTSSIVASAVVTSPRPTQAPARAGKDSPSPWPKIAAGVSVLALAAGALLWLKQPSEPAPLVTNSLPAPGEQTKPVAAAKAQSPEPAPNTIAPPSGVDPNSLPGESSPKVAEVAARLKAAPLAAAAASAKAGGEKIVLADEQPAAEPAPAEAVEKPIEKALPAEPALRPADSSSGELPLKPTTGAVQAALGSVMSGARHCVAGDEAPSSAVVVFGSDGHVQNVSVSGPAAGKSSAACIQAQLGRARVQPFAASSFSVNATVRPD